MIRAVEITNFKSIVNVALELGRINVFIGENGAGKSNILEALVLAGAARAEKLDNEFLTSRGIRVTQPKLMRSAFSSSDEIKPITIRVTDTNNVSIRYELTNENGPYSNWEATEIFGNDQNVTFNMFLENLKTFAETADRKEFEKTIKVLEKAIKHVKPENFTKSDGDKKYSVTIPLQIEGSFARFLAKQSTTSENDVDHRAIASFVVYSPENSALRTFEKEGQIEPLGINGEGLLKLLWVMSQTEPDTIRDIKSSLKLLGWFDDFTIQQDQKGSQTTMEIDDIYLTGAIDQKSANEGFLFLAFYFALFSTKLTPKFFAIDNIDASLNPKLCCGLVRQLVKLASVHKKQTLLTTHNPAVLDGLNLDDEDQRLFIVSRGADGQTRVKRVQKPRSIQGAPPIKLSEAFLRGSLGGLPKGF